MHARGAEAGFIGRTLDAVYLFPDASTPYAAAAFTPSSFAVGGSLETTGVVEGVTTLPVDFTDGSLTIGLDTVLANPTWTATAFNGIVFTLASPGSLGIAAAVVNAATTLPGFDNARVTFSDTEIGINWAGLSYTSGLQVVVDFTFNATPVPEPHGLMVLALAAIGLALSVRRFHRDP